MSQRIVTLRGVVIQDHGGALVLKLDDGFGQAQVVVAENKTTTV